MSKQVNRSLEDKDMDRIDHALGRPVDPAGETYRDYFATDTNSSVAKTFDLSPFWSRGKTIQGGMTYFHVSDEGRRALKDHLKAIGDKHRLFDVTFKGFTSSIVATSASKAKYSHWLDLSDTSDLKFRDFCRDVSVRPTPMTAAGSVANMGGIA